MLGFSQTHMANRVTLLEERLQRVDERSRRIMESATEIVPDTNPQEIWWPYVVSFYQDERVLFERVRIDPEVFYDSLAIVRDVTWEMRGRQSAIRPNREKLFFLMTFMSRGISTLEVLASRHIKTRDHIITTLKKITTRFLPILKAATVHYNNETVLDTPNCSLIVDCTVCQVKKPALHFDDAMAHFSGKHKLYCLKKEACLNIRSGTAAIVSKAFPGSVSDIEVLRSHSGEVNAVLAGRSMLADLGYRGVQHDVPTIVVCDMQHIQNRTRRVLVECYFGRLKCLWSVFSARWKLGDKVFDDFFDLACCFTNMDVLHRPLRETDREFNQGLLNLLRNERERALEERRLANAAYRERRRFL